MCSSRPGRWPRAAAALLVVVGACSGGVDPSITPDSLWVRATAAAPVLPDGVRIRALTLNLHGGQDATLARVAEALVGLDLDLVGLEECPAAYATGLAEALGGYARAGDEGNVLLSRTPLTSTRSVSMISGRGFTHALTEIEGQVFSVYVAHIGWNAEGSRQARELVDEHLARDPHRRLLVVGDFNDEHLSPQASILESLLEDTFTASGVWPGQRISWPATGFDGSEGSQLIDLHYYRRADPAVVVSAEVLDLLPPISDHKPTVAELVYPRGDTSFVGVDPFPGRREPWAVVVREAAPNRLLDPGAEEGGRGWTPEDGGEVDGEREHQPPAAGARQFTGASGGSPRAAMISGWSQRVALADRADVIDARRAYVEVAGTIAVGHRLDVEGEVVASSPRPYDEGEVVVDLEDAEGRRLLRWTSGRRDPLRHHPFGARIPAPPGTRAAIVRLWSHLKENSGPSHDAVFDELHLALTEGAVHGARAERWTADAEADGAWGELARLGDGEAQGLMIYPPRSRSGRGLWVAGLDGRDAVARAELPIEAGELSFGGWARTHAGVGRATLALELYEDGAEAPWGTLALPALGAAQWTSLEGTLRIPEGLVRAVVVARAEPRGDVVYLDELYVR